MKSTTDTLKINQMLDEAMAIGREKIPFGEVATYIPELGKVDKNDLGMVIATKDGQYYERGLSDKRFTIQSMSKVISLILALEYIGYDAVFDKVEMEPSGEAFNSLVELDLQSNKPFNPMINSGALAVESLLMDKFSFEEMTNFARKFCSDDEIMMNENVFNSEMSTCDRNRAIGYLLKSKGIIDGDVEKALELYTKMCSLSVSARSLANLGLLLAMDGIDIKTGERLISSNTVRIVKTIMLTCGMYDGSGKFAVEVGFPTKSGVGGGLLSVVDKEAGIGIYGPSLDIKGNSIAGCASLHHISNELGLHIFHP